MKNAIWMFFLLGVACNMAFADQEEGPAAEEIKQLRCSDCGDKK